MVEVCAAYGAEPFAIGLADIAERLGRQKRVTDKLLKLNLVSVKEIRVVVLSRRPLPEHLRKGMFLRLQAFLEAAVADEALPRADDALDTLARACVHHMPLDLDGSFESVISRCGINVCRSGCKRKRKFFPESGIQFSNMNMH